MLKCKLIYYDLTAALATAVAATAAAAAAAATTTTAATTTFTTTTTATNTTTTTAVMFQCHVQNFGILHGMILVLSLQMFVLMPCLYFQGGVN
jgi:uncharacterized protein YggE